MPNLMQRRMRAPEKSRRGIGGVLKELFTYSGKLKLPSMVAFLFAVAGAILTIIGPKLLSQITDLISNALGGEIDLAAIGRIGVLLLIIYGLSAVLTYVEHFIMATVTLDLGEAGSVSAISGADGKAYLFPKTDAAEYAVFAGYGDERTAAVRTDEGSCFVTLEETRAWSGLDLCFMIDTTGSMGDELRYLQSEVADVIERVTTELSETDIALAFVFYRDEGDEYKVKSSDFTSDIAAQQRVLASESASGGGDTPEAVHEALQEVLGLSWREGTRKILIPVLDAPPHDVPEKGHQKK